MLGAHLIRCVSKALSEPVNYREPGSVFRRRQRNESTRARLVEAARSLFIQQGYEASTLRQIAHEAGVTTGALTTHFPNKQALWEHVMGDAPTGDNPAAWSAPVLVRAVEDLLAARARSPEDLQEDPAWDLAKNALEAAQSGSFQPRPPERASWTKPS